MQNRDNIHVVEDTPFDCPNCGHKISHPFGGHTWTCHETYGGCGAKFKPVRAFKQL